jgi:YD repeat-containing protein
MSTVSDFFTQASNFVSAVSGQVDPRTGLYGININAGHLMANNLMGPALPLMFSYSPMNTANVGLGVGVSFGMSTYVGDSEYGMLTLGSGERYRVENGVVQQKKLDSFRFDMSEGNYRIYHKDGGVEILTQRGNVSVPRQIFNSSGHSIALTWDRDNNDNVVLTRVTDETLDPKTKKNTTLLSVTYLGNAVEMQVLPDQDEGYSVSLTLDYGYRLAQVTSNAAGSDELLKWVIDYTNLTNWGLWATSLTSPGGLVETVQYNNGDYAQKFPDGSGLPPLPCVYLFTTTGTDTVSEIEYTFSTDGNFLGANSGISGNQWKKDQDNLYNASSSYKYSSTQTHTDEAGVTTVITRTYNNYHLLVTQTSTNLGCTTTQATEYYIDPSELFEDQPSQYQLPKTRTITWSQGARTRSEKTITSFDDSGNPLTKSIVSIDAAQKETPIQTKTEWTYYSKDGETGCPTEPNGFTRFIKTMTVTSATPVTSDLPYAVPPHVTTYTYAGLDTPPGAQAAISTAIMVASEQHYSDIQLLSPMSKTVYSYANKADTVNDFCRLLSTESTHYPSGENGPKPTTKTTSTWTLKGSTLIENKTLTAGAQNLTSAQTQSLFTARTLSSTDALEIVNEAVYDRLGRVIQVTTAKGTDYANTRTCEYKIKSDTDSDTDTDTDDVPFLITAVDANNNKIRTTCNAAGKPIRVDAWLADDPSQSWKTIKTANYDTQMRPLTVVDMDYLPSAPTAERLTEAPSPDQSLTVTLGYDGWGQNHLNWVSDGVKHWSVTDPIAMTVTTYMTAGDKDKTQSNVTVTTYNYNRQPIKIQAYDDTCKVPLSATAKASSTVLQKYDGWNQLREHTDELTRVTSYDYDVFGRVNTTILPKINASFPGTGTKVSRFYSPFSPLAWLADIQVTAEAETRSGQPPTAAVSMGTQKFDELGRVTQRSSGGRTWNATYNSKSGSVTSPATVTSPANNTLNYQYIAALGGKVSRVEKSTIATQNKVYTYSTSKGTPNKIVGSLLTASVMNTSNSSTLTNTYALTGRLATETLVPSAPATDYKYTVAGKATHYTDVAGITQAVEYDGYGRPRSISDSDVSAVLTYDDLGRLQAWETTDLKSKATLTTTIELDGLGREVKRTLTSSLSNNSWALAQAWYDNHQLKTKTLSRGDKTARTETYIYDARNRLTQYTAEIKAGNENDLPQDEKGNRITSQSLIYDAYSNIKSITSSFLNDQYTDTMICTYNGNDKDPCQLTKVTHSHPTYAKPVPTEMKYNPNGFLTYDGVGRNFTDAGSVLEGYLFRVDYSVAGQSPKSASYQYDAMNRLIKQDGVSLYYRGSKLVNQVEGNNGMRLLSGPGGNLAQIRTGTNPSTWLSGIDANGSVLSVENGGTQVKLAYGPYGEQS